MKIPSHHRRTTRLAALAAAAVPVLAACGSSAAETTNSDETMTFAAVPAESSTSLESDYSNITELIEKETGVKVTFQNAADYAAVVEGQRAGKIDLASYGPFSYIIAKDQGVPIEAIAAPTSDEAKKPAYTSHAYVRADSDVQSLKDLKGEKVCFVDAASTSGYLVPMKGLKDEGLDMKKDVTPVLAGGHDASLLSLKSGQCEAAFTHDTMLQTLESSGQVKKGELRKVWQSEEIPEDPIALNEDTLDPKLAEEIATAIREKANKPALVEAGICESESDCVLPEEIEYGYRPVEDADYDPIRQICDETKADACRTLD
ncbi:phosphate/phosphite/phosphonate ABC transporter substrate-binding protein [Janibacter corallicola]|uniref:phosphate/phosphite/phosphonate ABC transporter substrate-binding protein n=1 Tax=Janibacter corallicola TaxID=415212 RepID=UPI00082DC40E|nr:phosphate/phosphite/phosphonate ABC transporter substrate-binding protein [Janibacter corallicola]